MSKKAMKLALEALEDAEWYINWLEMIVYSADDTGTHENRLKVQQAITALQEALAEQPVQHEPVFWTRKQWGMDREFCEKPFTTDWEPLYTSPPAQRTWVGLDNDDLVWIYSNSDNVGQAISNTEAKLKEKNT